MSSLDIFHSIPRLSLAPLNTPIHCCQQLPSIIKNMPELYLKRDDFIGPLVWGNKLRKLEYSLAAARAAGADTIITTGGIQSNHARTTAQVARQEGFKVILVLNGNPPDQPTANYLVNKTLGVEIHHVLLPEERNPKMLELKLELDKAGKKAFIIPLGASDEIGTLGFIKAVEELSIQEKHLGLEFDTIIHASSSGGTQAGLIIGKKLFGLKAKIVGISADNDVAQIRKEVRQAGLPILQRLKMNEELRDEDILVDTGFIGPGYGISSDASIEAADLFARHEGILVDQTYSGKAAAALIKYARSKRFSKHEKVLFWHTGGTIGIFR